jgi:hypothetical protein
VGGRAHGRRARHPDRGQGDRERHAARRDDREGRRDDLDEGDPRTAATRSPARRRSRRST